MPVNNVESNKYFPQFCVANKFPILNLLKMLVKSNRERDSVNENEIIQLLKTNP